MKNILENHFIGLMIILWIIYIIPIIIASFRRCNHINGIALVNILLGASLLGWVGALVWAVLDKRDSIKLSKHKNWGYISLVVFAIGLFSSIWIYNNTINKPHDDIEKATPAYSFSTEEIWKQFNAELKTADSLYTGKVIQLSGTVSRVNKNDTIVSVIFVMAADEMFGDKTISCQMYKRHNEEAQAITAGTPLKIKGFCTGYNDTDLIFNKCSIIK